MKRTQHERKQPNNDFLIEILLGIICLELVFGLFDPTFLPGLGHTIYFALVHLLRLGFYVSVLIVCWYLGEQIGNYLKENRRN